MRWLDGLAAGRTAAVALEPHLQTVHVQVNHRRGEQRQRLAQDQAANNGDA